MKRTLMACVLVLALAGCGDDKPSSGNPMEGGFGPGGMPGGFPGGPGSPNAWQDMMKSGGTIKLTDEMMERYVSLIKDLKGVSTPGAALLARHQFDMQQWAMVSMVIGSSTARASMSDSRPHMREQLTELEAQRDAATDPDQRKLAESQIQALQKQLEALGEIGEANEVDRHNLEVIERWQERLEAAGR